MQNITTCLDRLDKLAGATEQRNICEGMGAAVGGIITTHGPGLSSDVLAFVESALNLQLYSGIKETFQRYNGLYMGIEVYSLEQCLLLTLQCREEYTDRNRRRKLKKSLVISGDGSGNPILISSTGQLYLFHHDDSTYEVLEDSYQTIFSTYLDYLENHAAANGQYSDRT